MKSALAWLVWFWSLLACTPLVHCLHVCGSVRTVSTGHGLGLRCPTSQHLRTQGFMPTAVCFCVQCKRCKAMEPAAESQRCPRFVAVLLCLLGIHGSCVSRLANATRCHTHLCCQTTMLIGCRWDCNTFIFTQAKHEQVDTSGPVFRKAHKRLGVLVGVVRHSLLVRPCGWVCACRWVVSSKSYCTRIGLMQHNATQSAASLLERPAVRAVQLVN